MVVHEFIRGRRDAWAQLQVFLEKARRLSLARVPLDVFREGSALYRQAVADLAYARMCFPDHPVVRELEQLVGHAHSLLYQAGRTKSRSWTEFWRETWPMRVREAARPILLATGLFWAGAVLGFVLTALNPTLESFFVSRRDAGGHCVETALDRIAHGHRAGGQQRDRGQQYQSLALDLGAGPDVRHRHRLAARFQRRDAGGHCRGLYACRNALAPDGVRCRTRVPGTPGHLDQRRRRAAHGRGHALSRRYSRRVELRLKGRSSVQIIVGIVPILLVAGAIEGFVSPSSIPGAAKASLGLVPGGCALGLHRSGRASGYEVAGRHTANLIHSRRTTRLAMTASSHAVRSASIAANGDHSSRMSWVSLGRPRIEIANPPIRACRTDRAANALARESTASTRSSDKTFRSIAMTRDKLPDISLCEVLLLFGILLGPSRLGRNSHEVFSCVQKTLDRSYLVSRSQRPESRHIFEDYLGLARELDGKVHGRLLYRGRFRHIIADRHPDRSRKRERTKTRKEFVGNVHAKVFSAGMGRRTVRGSASYAVRISRPEGLLMHIDPQRMKALFNSTVDLRDPADRPAFLDRECGDNPELRRRLDELLAAYDGPASAVEPTFSVADVTTSLETHAGQTSAGPNQPLIDEQQTASFSPEDTPPAALFGNVIAGRYKIRQEIGEGGMGSVYLAEQTQPVKRKVALKLIKAGMDSRAVLARFESERQALALMDHPNIARVLDGGTTESGRPFFVMDLVNGIPLTDYCDQHCLDLLQRLTLFRQICSAVQHAHQKGVIHRDLKPSNILVESHDGHPVPKVIDFGLAKAISGLKLSEQSLFTPFGTVAGTPLYMAPEQADSSALDIDTRADIYALGVILYELLTGSTPIPRESFKRAAFDEMLRLIREVEPPTPSSRISSSQGLPTIAASRQIEPARLGRFVRGDLDWIVMKALAKERHRRYDSPIAFAHDIERFLAHEPVSAGPPTATYRFKKFIRRHRPQVIAASLLLVVLVGGIVGTTLGLFEARRQQGIALAEAREKEKAREAESIERIQAVNRLAQVEKANDILGSIFKDLNPLNAEREGKPLGALLAEHLDQATTQIEGEAIGDPVAVAQVQYSLGEAQLGLGFPEKAISLLTKARATFAAQIGPDHRDTLATIGGLARGYRDAGQVDRALALFKEALPPMQAKLGDDDPLTLATMKDLAFVYVTTGQLDQGLPLSEQALALCKPKLGPDHPETIATMSILAIGYNVAGQFDRSVPLFEEVLALRKRKLGPDHPKTLGSMYNLASALHDAGQNDRAVPVLEQTLKLRTARLGPDHPDTLVSMTALGTVYQIGGKVEQALPLLEASYHLSKAKFGPDNPRTLLSMINLGGAYKAAGQLERAIPLLEEGYRLGTAKLGPDHPQILSGMIVLGQAYTDAGQLDRALPLLEESYQFGKTKLGPDHPHTFETMSILAVAYHKAGRFDKALPLFEETLTLRTARLGPNHSQTLDSMENLARAYKESGKLDRVLPMLRKIVDLRKRQAGADSAKYADGLAALGDNLLDESTWSNAEAILREALAIREAKQPAIWTTFETRSLLGGALLGQKRYAEAEPLLRAGYEGMKQRAQSIPSDSTNRLGKALDRLISLAAAMNRLDDEKKWKDEKTKLPVAADARPRQK